MSTLSADDVWRDDKVKGDRHSGPHDPDKADIRRWARGLENLVGSGVSRRTEAQLKAVTPEAGTFPLGAVTKDPDASKIGFWTWSGTEWLYDRPFPDTVSVLDIVGGTADAVEAASRPGISPGNVLIFLVQPNQTNTGAVTLSLDGNPALPVFDVNGDELAPGIWTAGRLIQILHNGDEYRLLSDPDADGAAAAAAQSASDAKTWAEAASAIAIPDGSIGTAELADGSVTLAKLDASLTLTVPALSKASPFSAAIKKTGAETASIAAGTVVKVGSTMVSFSADTAITMPTLTAGTDYAVFVSDAGAAQAVAWTENTGVGPTPPSGTWTWIGGFHHAPGGNATGYDTGGDRTPAINAFSCWDLRFRPKCSDPRGMSLAAGKYWFDIYFLGVDHHLAGTSRHGVNIATGTTLPKLPVMFGGNGTTLVTQLDWYWAYEILDSHEKRMLSLNEFRTAAFGVVEEAAGGRATPAVKTGINFDNDGGGTNNDERYTSMWGMNLSIANAYVWGQDIVAHSYGGNYDDTPQDAPGIQPFYYQAYNGRKRGYSPQLSELFLRGMLFGGSVGSNAVGRSGSGSADSANAIQSYSANVAVRGAADHLIL